MTDEMLWQEQAGLICRVLVAEIGQTTVWADIYKTAMVIAHVRRLEEEHKREMIHLYGPRVEGRATGRSNQGEGT